MHSMRSACMIGDDHAQGHTDPRRPGRRARNPPRACRRRGNVHVGVPPRRARSAGRPADDCGGLRSSSITARRGVARGDRPRHPRDAGRPRRHVIVVDASAIVEFVARQPADFDLARRILGGRDLHAPHLLDVEVTQALRALVSRSALSSDRASDARIDAADLRITRYPHLPLLARAWELRHSLSTYDGVYVALAEALRAPLVTCDARLARASGHDAEIELFAAG